MFASDRTSGTGPARIFDPASPAQSASPKHPPSARAEGGATGELWPTQKQSISLHRCDDEPALEYGCVDWFLYDKQRSQ